MSWRGSCNRCGRCCQQLFKLPDGRHVLATCQNLAIDKPLGQPEASRCKVYEERWPGMPVRMEAPRGDGTSDFFASVCDAYFPADSQGVPPECSYEWAGSGPRPERTPLVVLS